MKQELRNIGLALKLLRDVNKARRMRERFAKMGDWAGPDVHAAAKDSQEDREEKLDQYDADRHYARPGRKLE